MATPQIPPRPIKLAQQPPTDIVDAPRIPPRPAHRAMERSTSRDNFPRSPLNEVPFATNHRGKTEKKQYQNDCEQHLTIGLPKRPSSVSLPSVGQEGSEYADIVYETSQDAPEDSTPDQNEPEQTRNVGSDLPLHAPTPSFSTSTAKARVSVVTHTDSVQAAAAGIGKVGTPVDDKNPQSRALHPKVSFSRTESSASTERPESAQATDSDHGIPEIGQRVPMYPDAGDVQAPSPAPFSPNIPPGASAPYDGNPRSGRHHSRTRSGREVFRGPPGSYGMHGHGVQHNDQFEKAWYDKHPDALVREESGQYGPGIGGGRGEWALSSEDLNKIVRDTARRGSGFGTSANIAGLPNEQIGYIASEEYASRINSPATATYQNRAHSNHSQTHVESPLRKASFPVDVDGKTTFDESKGSHGATHHRTESALESENEDDEIHVDAPAFRISKYTGNGYDPPKEDLGPLGGNTDSEGGWIQETGYGVPILASDEVAKEPGSEYLQPAVSPVQERRGSNHYTGVDSDAPPSYQSGHRNKSRSGSASNSRPSSRPGSIHGSIPGLSRLISHDEREDMHTPLEDVDEYEPLFPEEDDKESRSIAATERFNRRENLKRRFPSQDIWEDTPNSLQLQATVETPEPVEELQTSVAKEGTAISESPETEALRKGEIGEEERAKLIPKEERLAKSSFKPHLREESSRPGSKQRFPSRDIWEDSPDSARLETTVEEPQSEETKSPLDEGIKAGALVLTSGRPDKIVGGNDDGNGSPSEGPEAQKPNISQKPLTSEILGKSTDAGSQSIPNVPARPVRRLHQVSPSDIVSPLSKTSAETSPTDSKQSSPSEVRKAPVLPDRPKPQIPARPPKSASRDASETSPLSRTISASSTGSGDPQGLTSPPAPKPKPVLPSRPIGGKIASLKAGFLSDLDKRLQVGPQAPKAQEKSQVGPETEEEKAPLADARKGRAKGPARRKPAPPSTTAAAVPEETSKQDGSKWVIQEPWTVWQTEDDGTINAPNSLSITQEKASETGAAQSPERPLPLNDSMSTADTPTSSRDENSPPPDDSIPSDQFPTGGATNPLTEEIPHNTQPVPASPPTSPKVAGQTDDNEGINLNTLTDQSQESPAGIDAVKHEEGKPRPIEEKA